MKRITKKQAEKFVTVFSQEIIGFGAKLVKEDTYKIEFSLDIDKIGLFIITIFKGDSNVSSTHFSLFGRFENPEKAKHKFDCNPYTGKMNLFIPLSVSAEHSANEAIFNYDCLFGTVHNELIGIDKEITILKKLLNEKI